MWRLVLAILIVTPAVSCNGDGGEEGGDPTAADSVTQWIQAAEATAVRTPNGQACLSVSDEAFPAGFVGGDSLRITIRHPPTLDLLPPDLPSAFQAAQAAGQTVFPPLYEFAAYDGAGQEVTEFADSITVAVCAHYEPGQEASIERALLARPDPDSPETLQFFRAVDPPEACDLRCPEEEESARQAALPMNRWLTGSPITATPAHAQCSTCFKGIGGGGPGKSPIAAVDTVVGASGMEEGVIE